MVPLKDGAFQAQLPNGITAGINVPERWPEQDAVLTLTSLKHADNVNFDDVMTDMTQDTVLSKGGLNAFLNAVAAAAGAIVQ